MRNIYLDENLSHNIADALNNLNKVHFPKHKVLSTKKVFGQGVHDEDIIPPIGLEKGALITMDNRLRTSSQFELCRKHNIFIFFILNRKNKSYKHWDIVRLLINHWEKIMDIVDKSKPPAAYLIKTRGGLEKID